MQETKIIQKGVKGYIGEEEIKQAKDLGISLGELTESWSWSELGLAKENMEEFCIPYIKDNFTIVEIGTGTGKYAVEILEKFPNVEYYSFEPKKILEDYLQDFFKEYKFFNLPANGYQLTSIDDNSVDMIHANGVFVYIEQEIMLNYIEEAARKLKKGGYLVFDVHNSENEIEGFLDHVKGYTKNFAGRVLWSAGFLKKYLADWGFERLDIKDHGKRLNYRTYMVYRKIKD